MIFNVLQKVSIHVSGKPAIELEGGVVTYNGQVLTVSKDDELQITETSK